MIPAEQQQEYDFAREHMLIWWRVMLKLDPRQAFAFIAEIMQTTIDEAEKLEKGKP